MVRLNSLKRKILIRKLKKLNFEGPYTATRHEYMIKDAQKIFLPNPHGKDIGVPLIRRIVKQIDVSRKDFLEL